MSVHWLPKHILTCSLLLTSAAAQATAETVEDLPTPYNLQAVVVNREVTLSWEWDPPSPSPTFSTLGYEVRRATKTLTTVSKTAYTDSRVPIGTHTYQVRTKGTTKQMGKKITLLS